MDTKEISKSESASMFQDVEKSWDDEFQELVQTLPKEQGWGATNLYFYQGFWCPSFCLKAAISFHKHFQAFETDIIVASVPKCGTTWLKALTFSTLYRNQFAMDEHPLLTFFPHDLVRFFELDLYLKNPLPDLENKSPRLFSTHVPYSFLPASINDTHCKIVFICRNPMDMFISLWLFTSKLQGESQRTLSLDEAFDKFINGVYAFGPVFDNILGYWEASQENPNKVLFLQYEDLKEDIHSHVKNLAIFLGVPFTEEEEKQGVVEEIVKMCSFENLKEMEVNKNGLHSSGILSNKDFFRKGKVGDWNNYLTPSMVEGIEKLIQEKFGTCLTFKLSSKTSKDAAASA